MNSKLYEHVKKLSEKHRGAGTEEEARARAYIVKELQRLGYKPSIDPFYTPPSFSYTYITIYMLPVLSAAFAVMHVGIAVVPIALAGVVLLVMEEELYIPILTRLYGYVFRGRTANIVVKIGSGARVFVLMAHYDSTKAAYSFNPKRVHTLRSTIKINFASTILASGLSIGSLYIEILAIASVAASIPLIVSISILIHRELFHTYVPGANDNASGVAVLLGVAEALAGRSIDDIDKATIYVVFTGAEEVGLLGSHTLYRREKWLLREAVVINIDNPGAGDLALTECEGVLKTWCPDKRFRDIVREYAVARGIGTKIYKLLPTDATHLMMKGLRATSIMAFEKGSIKNYHWYTDTAEHIDPENLSKAVNIVIGMIEMLIKRNP